MYASWSASFCFAAAFFALFTSVVGLDHHDSDKLHIRRQFGFGRNRNGGGGGGGGAAAAGGCSTLQMIVARASTEAPGEGIIGAVADGVKKQVAGSDSQAVDYPATLGNYASSEAQGFEAMVSDANAFAAKCANTPIVLMGYSQGAQVTGDAISGGATGTSGRAARGNTKLTQAAADNVVAIVQMGDPTFVPSKNFNVGSSNDPGVFERQDTSGNSLATHLGYVREFGTDATDFIVGKANGAAARRVRARRA
ncbi:hypothetical protein JCM8097_004124 [Rhodosporidiobolus ruineniae]